MYVSFNWLKKYVDIDVAPEKLAHIITMGGVEVEGVEKKGSDFILDITPTPNRGDCLSVIGVAKEVAALLNKRVRLPKFDPPRGKKKVKEFVDVIVKDKSDCPRYTARFIEGVKVKPSPAWLKEAVESAGLRSINNVVDATNYVLMELGQPVHAFDLRYLKGSKLIIDRPPNKLKLLTLDEIEREYTSEDILNMDGERAIGVAGIMGAENSGVTPDTTMLVLESAYFNPLRIRRTSKRTGLSSDSSRRFEKGVDPFGVINGLHRLTEIILDVAGGTPSSDWVDFYPEEIKPALIELDASRVNWLLGTEIETKTISSILKRIGCKVKDGGKGDLRVVPPTHRPDLERPVDLVEEVARIYGYKNIGPTMPFVRASSIVRPDHFNVTKIVRELMVDMGFYESVTYSFTSKEDEETFGDLDSAVRLSNPLTSDMEYMRTTLVPGLLSSLVHNLNRQIDDVKLFEMSRTFRANGGGLPDEMLMLSGVMTGRRAGKQWGLEKTAVDLYDAKAAIWSIFERLGLERPEVGKGGAFGHLHPQDSFVLQSSGNFLGYCGRLNPRVAKKVDLSAPVYLFELNFDEIAPLFLRKGVKYKPISRYPSIYRDVALLVKSDITHKELLQSFKKYVNNTVQRIELFDIYSGKGIPDGCKSMAYTLCFASDERTLSDEEVEKSFNEIIEGVKRDTNAGIR